MNPQYPIYIISKGRYKQCLTSRALEKINVPYNIVIEPKEYDEYCKVIDKNKILVLPSNFSELGQGSIPVRNWVWEHSIEKNSERHWILDDNIHSFRRFNKNFQIEISDGTIFKCAEDFVNRYDNVALAGFQYDYFVVDREVSPAYVLNTRIYSTILIKNDIPYRWRGKYNEDTDLSIRVLKDKYCTILFYAFIQEKAQSMTIKGGNTNTIYNTGDERFQFAQSLADQHPDIVKVVRRYDRWHHQVDYKQFKNNKLIKKKDLIIPNRVNNYGMVLMNKEDYYNGNK
jgi:hypothetical protein